jgi:hypothetical protein
MYAQTTYSQVTDMNIELILQSSQRAVLRERLLSIRVYLYLRRRV